MELVVFYLGLFPGWGIEFGNLFAFKENVWLFMILWDDEISLFWSFNKVDEDFILETLGGF